MSNLIAVSIDGVLGQVGEPLRTAQPNMRAIHLLRSIATGFPNIGYVTEEDPEIAADWLRTYDAPIHQWIVMAMREMHFAEALRKTGRRLDRLTMFIDHEPTHVEACAVHGVPLLVWHAVPWASGDWRPTSSWSHFEPEEESEG